MHRIGLVLPSSNVVVEDTLRRLAGAMPAGVGFHVARFPVVTVDLGDTSTGQFDESPVDTAIDRLCDAGVDEIVFAGTAGAWLGIDRERDWRDRTEKRTGLRTSSTTLMTLDRLMAVTPRRLGLVTPFRADVHERIARNFRGEGLTVSTGIHLGLDRSHDMAAVPPAAISEHIRTCIGEGCDTVLCFCTNFRGYEAAQIVATDGTPAALFDSVGITFETMGARLA